MNSTVEKDATANDISEESKEEAGNLAKILYS